MRKISGTLGTLALPKCALLLLSIAFLVSRTALRFEGVAPVHNVEENLSFTFVADSHPGLFQPTDVRTGVDKEILTCTVPGELGGCPRDLPVNPIIGGDFRKPFDLAIEIAAYSAKR